MRRKPVLLRLDQDEYERLVRQAKRWRESSPSTGRVGRPSTTSAYVVHLLLRDGPRAPALDQVVPRRLDLRARDQFARELVLKGRHLESPRWAISQAARITANGYGPERLAGYVTRWAKLEYVWAWSLDRGSDPLAIPPETITPARISSLSWSIGGEVALGVPVSYNVRQTSFRPPGQPIEPRKRA